MGTQIAPWFSIALPSLLRHHPWPRVCCCDRAGRIVITKCHSIVLSYHTRNCGSGCNLICIPEEETPIPAILHFLRSTELPFFKIVQINPTRDKPHTSRDQIQLVGQCLRGVLHHELASNLWPASTRKYPYLLMKVISRANMLRWALPKRRS